MKEIVLELHEKLGHWLTGTVILLRKVVKCYGKSFVEESKIM